jgi:hypothetical protein
MKIKYKRNSKLPANHIGWTFENISEEKNIEFVINSIAYNTKEKSVTGFYKFISKIIK